MYMSPTEFNLRVQKEMAMVNRHHVDFTVFWPPTCAHRIVENMFGLSPICMRLLLSLTRSHIIGNELSNSGGLSFFLEAHVSTSDYYHFWVRRCLSRSPHLLTGKKDVRRVDVRVTFP
jgi:hypothetical protein